MTDAEDPPLSLARLLGTTWRGVAAAWDRRTLPSGELVLQMTKITSWGEEAPAVRMVFVRS